MFLIKSRNPRPDLSRDGIGHAAPMKHLDAMAYTLFHQLPAGVDERHPDYDVQIVKDARHAARLLKELGYDIDEPEKGDEEGMARLVAQLERIARPAMSTHKLGPADDKMGRRALAEVAARDDAKAEAAPMDPSNGPGAPPDVMDRLEAQFGRIGDTLADLSDGLLGLTARVDEMEKAKKK